MNLIQISEQLKDVPDQFLVGEIQNPTGSYPAYLVVSELTRRKRMREGALKEEPQTTVSEDLMGITAAPEAAESTLGSARQQMAQMPPQMAPQMPAQLAGQMPQMPQMMAGGGLVAFERGGPIRAFDGMFTGDYTQGMTEQMPRAEFINELSLSELQEYNRTGKIPERLSGMVGGRPISTTDPFLYMKPKPASTAPAVAAAPAAAPKPAPNAPPAPGPNLAPAAPPTGIRAAAPGLPVDLQALVDTARGQSGIPSEQQVDTARGQSGIPSEQQVATARAEGAREFEERFPFRQKEILERRIAERTEELQRDKKMNFNDALLAAGAAILSAPGGGTKWMGEGLKAFNQTMIEGKKDMRKAQQLIEQSEMDLTQAEMLRDQGKFAAADRKEEKAFTRQATARQLANSDAALGLQVFKAQSDAAEQEAKGEYYGAYANLLRQGGAGALTAATKAGMAQPSSMDIQMARINAAQEFESAKIKATPAQVDERANLILQRQFPGYSPLPPVTPQAFPLLNSLWPIKLPFLTGQSVLLMTQFLVIGLWKRPKPLTQMPSLVLENSF